MRKFSCFVCPAAVEVEVPESMDDESAAFGIVARSKDWAYASEARGWFLCCPDCYLHAFDLSKGGYVGFLRDEFKKYLVKH